MINIYNMDCMDYMHVMNDNEFDWAIVDPNYGIGASKASKKKKRIKQANGKYLPVKQSSHKHKEWDNSVVKEEVIREIQRVSKNQIIFGVNYFPFILGPGRIVWDKLNEKSHQFDCEIAYCSLNNRTDIVYYKWAGMMQGKRASRNIHEAYRQEGNKKLNESTIHPTQKPVKLYQWILKNYCKQSDLILDTHLGSGSIAIACESLGYSLSATEIDKEYFEAAKKRLEEFRFNKGQNRFNFHG